MGETIHLARHLPRWPRARRPGTRSASKHAAASTPEDAERDYSLAGRHDGGPLFSDGRFFIFNEVLDGGGLARRAYLRCTDGSPAIWLGNGTALDIFPDGNWVVRSPGNSVSFRMERENLGRCGVG